MSLIAGLLLVTAVPAASAQAPVATPYRPEGAAPVRIDLVTPVVEVPLLLLGTAPRTLPVVEAFVNGRGPYRFAIETGAEFATITPKLANEIGLTKQRSVEGINEYLVDSLRVGNATFQRFTISELPTRATDIDGLLGLPIYGELLLTLDYPARKLRFERGALPAPDGRTILPLTKGDRGHFWRMPITIAGLKTPAVIDTRSSGTFGFTPEFVDSRHIAFEGGLRVVGMAAGAAIAPVQVKAGYLTDAVGIGVYTFPSPLAEVRPLPAGFPQDPLVGTQVLQNFVLTLDQKNARVRLLHDGSNSITLPRRELPPPSSQGAAPSAPPGARRVQLDPAEYVGTWGDRRVTFENEEFYLQRPNGRKYQLVAKSLDTFGIKDIPQAEFIFKRDAAGKVIELKALNQDGQWETVMRTPATP